MALISLRSVTKNYLDGKTWVHALRGVDLDIARGEFTAIAGPSGSGKTTLLNLVGGLDAASGGSIRVGDRDLSGMTPGALTRLRLRHIGFVFQSYNLIPVLSARENVEFTLHLQGVARAERVARAEAILERVGLGEHLHRRPATLSGGQQQRVAVARAIVTHPDVILADEPTANLDSETGSDLLEMMRELNAAEQMTFVFSTHDPMVMDFSRRLIRLKDGRVAGDERRE
jgi:putative ABC transport system ATP-binding protein